MAASRSMVSYILIISIICLILLLYYQYKISTRDEKSNPLSIVGLSIGEMLFSAVITFTTLILI